MKIQRNITYTINSEGTSSSINPVDNCP